METEQEGSEVGIIALGDNADDSKEEGDDEDADEDKEMEEAEEVVEDGMKSSLDKSHVEDDAFDNFEFVRQDANVSGTSGFSEEEAVPEASTWLEGDKLYTAHINKVRHFVCIDYPGVIQNQDKALATLGGLESLSKVISEDLKMELTFRPNDPYCKPTVGSFTHSNNLLVKIRRRRRATVEAGGCGNDGFEYQVEVIGTVDKVYAFDRLCDFQYLPVTKTREGTYEEILSSIRPNIRDDRSEYLSRSIPLFLPPMSFSRREQSVSYCFESEPVQPEEQIDNYIGMDRKKRIHGTIHIPFSHPDVPVVPDPSAAQLLNKMPNHERALDQLRQIFEERPLWSKVGIMARLDPIYRTYLKFLLPMVAFYFINGPWKNLWCKFGYDPRKDPTSKIYQTLDYRVRSSANRQKIESKRGLEVRSFQYGLKQEISATLVGQTDMAGSHNKKLPTPLNLGYIFLPDHIPPYRQMRYQVCDVYHEEVQQLLHKNDGQESTCTERDGWCVPDFTDVCRDLISAAVDKLFVK